MKMSFKYLSVVITLVVLAFVGCNHSEKESMLIGNWTLSSYSDNGTRDAEQQAQFEQLTANLNIRLEFNSDKSFYRLFEEKSSGQKNEFRGEWYFENEERLLVLKIEGQPESKLLLNELTDEVLVLQVEEEGLTTTLSFKRP